MYRFHIVTGRGTHYGHHHKTSQEATEEAERFIVVARDTWKTTIKSVNIEEVQQKKEIKTDRIYYLKLLHAKSQEEVDNILSEIESCFTREQILMVLRRFAMANADFLVKEDCNSQCQIL